jgi:glc operon protein GlcG
VINRPEQDRLLAAAEIVFAEARRDGRAMAIAVTDEAGELVFGLRMPNCPARVLTHAIRKAYTSAVMQRDTIVFRDQDIERHKTLDDWGDPKLTHLVGGVVLRRGDEWFGGVAVGGNETKRDDEIARLALAALQLD